MLFTILTMLFYNLTASNHQNSMQLVISPSSDLRVAPFSAILVSPPPVLFLNLHHSSQLGNLLQHGCLKKHDLYLKHRY